MAVIFSLESYHVFQTKMNYNVRIKLFKIEHLYFLGIFFLLIGN